MRKELISKAVERRLSELSSQRVPQLKAQSFREMREFVSAVREQLLNKSSVELKNSLLSFNSPSDWIESDADCLTSLRELSVGKPFVNRSSQRPPLRPFLQELQGTNRDPERRFQLLADRYVCPLNFTLPAENEAREYVLRRLMVSDRARIEDASVAAARDDLLLKLNLAAVYAAATRDLRFLDALNYYYELLPATWHPQSRHGWLLASYFALYARALVAWL